MACSWHYRKQSCLSTPPVHASRTYRENTGIAALNFGNGRRWPINFTPPPLSPPPPPRKFPILTVWKTELTPTLENGNVSYAWRDSNPRPPSKWSSCYFDYGITVPVLHTRVKQTSLNVKNKPFSSGTDENRYLPRLAALKVLQTWLPKLQEYVIITP